MSEPLHPHEALHEAADGRLDAAALATVEAHLATCEPCRVELEAIRWTRAQLAAARTDSPAPAGFESWLQGAMASPPPASLGTPDPVFARPGLASRWRWAVAAGVAAVLLFALWALPRGPAGDVPGAVAADYRSWRAGSLALGVHTADVTAIEAWFRREGLGFDTRVFDLGMMRYTAVGGRVHAVDGQPSALFVYRGPESQALVCQMYEGRTADLAPPGRRATHNGIDFLIYERDGLTLVFWQEGNLVCVLAGEGDPKTVVDLAFAKAIKV